MKVNKAHSRRSLSLLLTLVLLLTFLSGVAVASAEEEVDFAVIDPTKTGSITVTKYATKYSATNSNPPKGEATGTSGDVGSIDSGYEPLGGAVFKLFKIADADAVMDYYNGTSTDTYDVSGFVYDEAAGTATYNGAAVPAAGEGTTAANGTYVFEDLPVGIYVLKEVTAPDQITAPLAETCLISIPMVNTATSDNNGSAQWLYDIHVYPKNHAATGNVTLNKVDQNGNALKDVTFRLFAKKLDADGKVTGGWEAITATTANGGGETNLTLQTGSTGELRLENLPANLHGTQYKLVEVYTPGTSPEGYIINPNPLYFKVNADNTVSWNASSGDVNGCNNENTGVVGTPTVSANTLTVTLRNEIPSLTKRVRQNGGDNWLTDEQYRLDDTIVYKLTAYVPNNIGELDTFTIKDVPDVGLADNTDKASFTVTCGETALDGGDFDVTAVAATGQTGKGFLFTLTDSGKTKAAGKTLEIQYQAHFTAKAVIQGEGNDNTATLTYSPQANPVSMGDVPAESAASGYIITDHARVYTYQFRITKYKDSVKAGNEIGGVQFKLLDSAKTATTKENVLNVVKVRDGVYRLALAGETTGTMNTLTTKSDGTILIQGLENGTYYLKETKTIANYNLLSKPFEFKVNVSRTTNWTKDGSFTSTGSIVKTHNTTTYKPTDPTGTATIVNKKGFTLPQTGSMGYLLFCTVGVVLIGGGAMLLFGGRKKKIR